MMELSAISHQLKTTGMTDREAVLPWFDAIPSVTSNT
jgi:hypothetical protein